MKPTTLLIRLLICFLYVSCSENVLVQKYAKEGVSFDYLSTWEITEEELLEEGVHYLAVEKKRALRKWYFDADLF
jgi:hypothetical protein